MVRDWETMRALLERFENETIEEFVDSFRELPPKVAAMSDEERAVFKAERAEQERIVFGHLKLLDDAGFIEGLWLRQSVGGVLYGVTNPRLTMNGHDALDAMRSKTVWGWVKEQAKSHGLPISAELIKLALARTV